MEHVTEEYQKLTTFHLKITKNRTLNLCILSAAFQLLCIKGVDFRNNNCMKYGLSL